MSAEQTTSGTKAVKLTTPAGCTSKEITDEVRAHLHDLIDAIAMEYDDTPSEHVTEPLFLALKQIDFIETELQGVLEDYVKLEDAKMREQGPPRGDVVSDCGHSECDRCKSDHKYDPVLLAMARRDRRRWSVEALSAMLAIARDRKSRGEPSLSEAAWELGMDAIHQAVIDVKARWAAMPTSAPSRRRRRGRVILGPNVIDFAAARALLVRGKDTTKPREL